MKAPIFLEAISSKETVWKPQYNLWEKDNHGILKNDFSPMTDPSIFTSTAPYGKLYFPPPPQKKKTWKFTSDDDNLIPFHFIPLFYCLTNKSHWMEIRIKLKIHNVHDTPLSRRKERKLVIRSQDPKTFKNISLLLTFNANQLPGFYMRAKLRFNQLTTQHSKMFYHISLGEKSCQKCHQENKNR